MELEGGANIIFTVERRVNISWCAMDIHVQRCVLDVHMSVVPSSLLLSIHLPSLGMAVVLVPMLL